jgi:glutaredoxin
LKDRPVRQKRVVLFTSPSCSWCSVAKKYFKDNNIRFKTIDVSRDKDAQKDCQRAGCRGVPVVLIGSRWICGFDKAKINKELGLR